jgi:hypothetical protein
MQLDYQNLFSDLQAITVTAASTNIIDLGTPNVVPGAPAASKRDLGGARNVPLLVQVTTAFAGGTSLLAELETSTDAAFTSPIVVSSSGVIPVAKLTVGSQLGIVMVPGGADLQYLRMKYTVAGTMSAGNMTAGIVTAHQTNG